MKVHANCKQGAADGHQGLGVVIGVQSNATNPLMKRVHQERVQAWDSETEMLDEGQFNMTLNSST